MKASTSFIAGLAIGAVGGIVAGAAYMKRQMEAYIDEQVDEEVKRFVDDYFARKEADEEEEEDDIFEEEDPYENPLNTYNSLQQNYHKPEPSKIFRDPLAEHPEEPDEESDILEENPVKPKKEDDDMKDPKLISEDKFDSEPEYEKETLYYYQGDDVLTDEDEHEVDNQLELVGDALDKFGFRDNDEQVIHVRNFEKKVDYEVIKAFTSFRD